MRPASGRDLLAARRWLASASRSCATRTFAHTFGAGGLLPLLRGVSRSGFDLCYRGIAVSAYVIIPAHHRYGKRRDSKITLRDRHISLWVCSSVLFLHFLCLSSSVLDPSLVASSGYESFLLLSRILLIQPICSASGYIFKCHTGASAIFLFALSPVLYNLGIIIGTVYLYPLLGLPGIGIGVVGGACAYLAMNIPVLTETGYFRR
jgi:putative peptidoglycan lipid II flippase